MSLATVHDWLLKSWLGLLATAVIGAFCYAVISKLLGRFLGWFTNTIPSIARSASRRTTVLRIERLKQNHNNTYVLLNTIVYECALSGIMLGVLIFLCIPISAMEADWKRRAYHLDPHLVATALLFFMIFNCLGAISVCLFQACSALLMLYRDLKNYDSTMEKLQAHLKDLDARDGRASHSLHTGRSDGPTPEG